MDETTITNILEQWDIASPNKIKRATSGLLNQTFLISGTSNQLYVLQQLHPAVNMDGAITNYYNITEHLAQLGRPTQMFIKTKRGTLWHTDADDNRWRLLSGVDGQVYGKTSNPSLAYEAGKLLGQLHTDLSTFSQPLDKGRVSHYYPAEIAKLTSHLPTLNADQNSEVR